MNRNHFALLLAGALVISQMTAGLGNDSNVGLGSSPSSSSVAGYWSDLGLPAIRHREDDALVKAKGSHVETLSNLELDTLGYFVVQPDIPGAQVCTGPK